MSTANQARATARRKERKAERRAAEVQEAALRGITVFELRWAKYAEVERIRAQQAEASRSAMRRARREEEERSRRGSRFYGYW